MLTITKRTTLILGEGIIEIYIVTFYAEKMYSINFTATKKKLCLSLNYNGDNSYLIVNGTEIIKFKAKDSEIVANPIWLGNASVDDPSVPGAKKLNCTVLYKRFDLLKKCLLEQ